MLNTKCAITTSPVVNTTSVVIRAANSRRLGFILYNNSNNSAYVTFGPISAGNRCAIIITAFAAWIWPYKFFYTGPISAIRNSGTGTFTVNEFEIE